MSETLRRYIILKFAEEFVFFFSILYLFSLMISPLRYGISYSSNSVVLPLLFSIYVLPFTLSSSFFISMFFTFRGLQKKLIYLRTFGIDMGKINRFIFLISVLFSLTSMSSAFLLSPKAFYLIEENLFRSIEIQNHGKRKGTTFGGKMMYAEKIDFKDKNTILAENGFIFDGQKTIKFRRIKFHMRSPNSRFTKDLVELLQEEGEKGKREIIYIASSFISPVSCSPFLFQSYAYLICNPLIVLISKLYRDSLRTDKLALTSLLTHLLVFFGSLFLMKKRKFER